MSRAPKSTPAVVAYQEAPVCSLTGVPWEIRHTNDQVHWFAVAVGKHGRVSTGVHQTKEQLLAFLSSRSGVRPDIPNQITVRESVEPEVNPADASVKQELELNEAAKDFAGRLVHNIVRGAQ